MSPLKLYGMKAAYDEIITGVPEAHFQSDVWVGPFPLR